MEISIISVGKSIPEYEMTNSDFEKMVDTNDQWIRERTGIETRRIAKEKSSIDLASEAAKDAIDRIQIDPAKIDIIIDASISGETKMPSVSCQVAGRIGAKNSICFDLNAACSGFIYALSCASSMLECMNKEYALVVGSEKLSNHLDWDDRNTCILFGDGAGATIIKNNKISKFKAFNSSGKKLEITDYKQYMDAEIKFFNLNSKPDMKNYLTLGSVTNNNYDNGNAFIKMNGRQIYKFATDIIPKEIETVLQNTGLNKKDISMVIPHQANKRIIETAAEKTKIPNEKWFCNLNKYGNTSAASIPLAFCEAIEQDKIKKNDNIIIVGFGGGLTSASMLMQWT